MTKVLSLPIVRDDANSSSRSTSPQAPRWCVMRFPAVGSDAVTIIGFDGEGYPLCKATVRLTSSIEMWERAAQIDVDAAKREAELRLSSFPLRRQR